MARDLCVEIVGDAASYKRALGQAGSAGNSFGSSLGRMAKRAALAGVALGAAGLAGVLKVGFGEIMESQKVAAQTEAVLKSTGAAANVTAAQVGNLSDSLARMSGVDDEAIQAGQNMLLTFKNVRNEIGEGRDIFTQATALALDYSVATGKNLTNANILLGKALNDPVKGLAALTRVGIRFTDAEKAMIKTMVDAKDT